MSGVETPAASTGSSDPYDRRPTSRESFLATLNDESRPVAESILSAFEGHESIVTVWRKTGFSLAIPMPTALTPGYKGNFSFLFFTSGAKNDGRGELRFDYPKWYADKFPKIKELTNDYMEFVVGLGLDEKYVLREPNLVGEKIGDLEQKIIGTAQAICDGK